MDAAQGAIDKVAPLAYDMLLLGEMRLCTKFQEVRQVGEFVAPAFRQYHDYLVANFDRIRDSQGKRLMGEAVEAEVHASVEHRRYDKAVQHLGRTHLDFQFAAQQKISPLSLPDGELPSSLDFDLPPMPPGVSQNPFRRPSSLDWNAGDTAGNT